MNIFARIFAVLFAALSLTSCGKDIGTVDALKTEHFSVSDAMLSYTLYDTYYYYIDTSSGRIRGNTAANGIHRILITVAVGSGNVPGLHPGYFFSPPELLILIYSGKIHHQYLYIFICIFHVHILPRNGR